MLIRCVVFLCGAVVMSFEILGSRVLAPNFGSSVFVWGSLISVFLAGLSAGYSLGGWMSDRHPSSKKLGLLIIAAGILLCTFPLYSVGISDWIFEKDFGVRLNPLLASLALFFLPAVFLGMVSPYTAKLMICSLHTSGRTIGSLYALSTFGSIVGTLLTSFWLITVAGTQALIVGQGGLLIAAGAPLLCLSLSCVTDARRASSGSETA
ncbi:MAG: hypothetical protein OHK006_02010 [Thermodesulfovibrionales bacterium]